MFKLDKPYGYTLYICMSNSITIFNQTFWNTINELRTVPRLIKPYISPRSTNVITREVHVYKYIPFQNCSNIPYMYSVYMQVSGIPQPIINTFVQVL